MKRFLPFLLIPLLIQCSGSRIAEMESIYDSKDYLRWSDKIKLSWSDFMGNPITGIAGVGSQANILFPTTVERPTILSTPKLFAFVVFDKNNSWVLPEAKNQNLLLYNQTYFDIYELHARKLKESFSNSEFGLNDGAEIFHRLSEENNKKLNDMLNNFQRDTELGRNEGKLLSWAEEVNDSLDTLKDYKY